MWTVPQPLKQIVSFLRPRPAIAPPRCGHTAPTDYPTCRTCRRFNWRAYWAAVLEERDR